MPFKLYWFLPIGAVVMALPAHARFLQVDPVGYEDHINLYLFVGNDPLNRLDPTGKRDIYIGGQWDKNNSRIVQNYAERQRVLHPNRDIRYFSHAEGAQIAAAMRQGIPINEPLNVIGHSRGAAQAIAQAEITGARIDNLITIDPVGSVGHNPNMPNVVAWANVMADPATRNLSDDVASIGRGLLGETDTSGADISVTSNASHGRFSTMMKEVNAQQAIDSSYQDNKPRCEARTGNGTVCE